MLLNLDGRFSAPDLDRLLANSPRLRGVMGSLRRNPKLAWRREAAAEFRLLCDEVRLQLRVAVEYPPGVVPPRNDREALAYMRCPVFCGTVAWSDAVHHVPRRDVDPRLLAVVYRLADSAAALGVPIAPSAFGEWATVHVGHCVHRYLPWACWDMIQRWGVEAGNIVGFPLIASPTVPGLFQLDPECGAKLRDETLRPKRLLPERADAEREALLRFYSGGSWEPHETDGEG